jgi:hypothetical protein
MVAMVCKSEIIFRRLFPQLMFADRAEVSVSSDRPEGEHGMGTAR